METIAATINESADTVEDVFEPFLMQLGFLNRTLRGRMATPAAYRYLGYNGTEKRGRKIHLLFLTIPRIEFMMRILYHACCGVCSLYPVKVDAGRKY